MPPAPDRGDDATDPLTAAQPSPDGARPLTADEAIAAIRSGGLAANPARRGFDDALVDLLRDRVIRGYRRADGQLALQIRQHTSATTA